MYSFKNKFNIQVGEVCITIECSDKYTLDRLGLMYSDFLCDGPADISLEIEIIESMSLEEIKRRVRNPPFYHQDGIFYDIDKLVSGEYNHCSKTVRVRAEKQLLTQSHGSYYLNQIICRLYYSSFYFRGVNKLYSQMVHSSAVVIDGYGLLFTGPSGIGKTTAAKLCSNNGNAIVINDEGNLISRPGVTGAAFTVQGIPVIGKLADKHNLTAPLICILFLKQSQRTMLHNIDRTDAFKRLLLQIVGNQYFGQINKKDLFASKAEFSEEITRHVPCYELEFTLDSGQLRNTLDRLKSLLLRGRELYVQ